MDTAESCTAVTRLDLRRHTGFDGQELTAADPRVPSHRARDGHAAISCLAGSRACHYELVDPASLGPYSHPWDGSDPDWVILATAGADDDGGSPYNRRTGMVELICDDDLAAAVLRTMRTHGVPVVQFGAPGDRGPRRQSL